MGVQSERDTTLPDGNAAVALFLVVSLRSVGNVDYGVAELGDDFLERLALDKYTGVEIHPMRFSFCQVTVGADLDGGHAGTKGCAAACREEDHLTTGNSKCGTGNKVVTGCTEQVQTGRLGTMAIVDDIKDVGCSAFLDATERLVLECGDAAFLVAR